MPLSIVNTAMPGRYDYNPMNKIGKTQPIADAAQAGRISQNTKQNDNIQDKRYTYMNADGDTVELSGEREKPLNEPINGNKTLKMPPHSSGHFAERTGQYNPVLFFNKDGDRAEISYGHLKAGRGNTGSERDAVNSSSSAERQGDCKTCSERRYVDESDDTSVSFQTPTKISPERAAAAVAAHENEHVVNERSKAEREGRKVVNQTVTIKYAICPECGKLYPEGGVTRTTTANKRDLTNNKEDNENSKPDFEAKIA